MMKTKRVFLTRTLHNFALKELKKRYEIEVHSGKIPIPRKKLESKIKDIEGLICFPYDVIDSKLLKNAKNPYLLSKPEQVNKEVRQHLVILEV